MIAALLLDSKSFIEASPLSLDKGYLLFLGSNVLLLMVVQQQDAILVFPQETKSTRHSTLS